MLGAMRGGAKSPIMKVFLLFLAGGFALWGVGDVTTGLIGGSDKAISAGDESASPAEVATQFDRTRRNFMPSASIGQALQAGLLNEVAGAVARDVVFRAEAASMGFTVTREMQRTAVASETAFQDETGNFSEGRFMQILGNARLTEAEYLQQIDSALRREQILGALANGFDQPPSIARAMTAFELERRDAKLISIPVKPKAIPAPDEQTISTWYEDVKTSYDAPSLRTARVGSLSPEMFANTIEIDDQAIATAYDARIDEFVTPETRAVRQMVFDDAESATTALSRINAGEDFAAVAADMLGWTEDDTRLGMVSQSDLDEPLGEAAFSLAQDEIAGPVETAFGQHLLLVDEINEGGKQSLADVSDVIRETLRNEAALDMIYDKLNALEDSLASGATLDEAMQAAGGRVDILANIDRNGFDIDGLPYAGDAADLAQDSVVLELIWEQDLNQVSVIQEGSDDTFFVVEPTAQTEQRSRSLDEVRTRAISDWKRTEAIKAALAQAREIANQPSAFEKITPTVAFNRNGIGLDHEAARLIAGAVFAQEIGAIDVVETGNEATAVMTISVKPAEQAALDRTAELVKTAIRNSLQKDVLSILARDLSQAHDLKINLARVQQMLAGAQ